jgi:hypothetical protein
MSGVDDNTLKLRAYLVALTPQARRRLGDQLARGVAVSAAIDAQAMLAELRRLADDSDGAAARLFFSPLEPFLIDHQAGRSPTGRIARTSLPALWAWIRHDLLPAGAAVFSLSAAEALEAGVTAHAERLASDFQDRVVAALRALFSDEDQAARRRMLMRIATPDATEEAAALRWILRGRDMLAGLADRLPATIQDLPPDQIPACLRLIEHAARPRDVFPYALLTFMRRLAAPWQAVRLAVRAAGSNSAARIAETSYGIVVDILLSDVECQTAALAAALADGEAGRAVALIRCIDATIQGLRSEIIVPVGSTLARRLSALADEAAAVARAALAA